MTDAGSWVIRPVTTDDEWLRAKDIRTRVFIEEQACPPEEEWDEHDWDGAAADARHFLVYRPQRAGDDGASPLGTARWRQVRWRDRPAAKLERFAVLPRARGEGAGRALVEHLLADARAAGFRTFLLHAQEHLEVFYADYGFVVDPDDPGARFEEAGIPHLRMVLEDPAARA